MMAESLTYFLPATINRETLLTIFSALVAALAGYVISLFLTRLLRHLPVRSFLKDLIESARSPIHCLLPLIAMQTAWGSAPEGATLINGLRHINSVLIISVFTWMLLRAVGAIERYISLQNPVDISDNLRARKIQTQTKVLTRSLSVLVLILGIAGILTTFPPVRQFGASLLASAGLAGLVLGFAAKPVLGNLIAGIQIAITQPIRLDDVVIMENEWGRVEEITGTYVVVRIWDNRRLIVPLQWVIEHPFENWTRQTSSLLSAVFFWLDYSVPIEPLREEANRLCREVPELWDGRVCVVQVTDCNETAMQVRVLGSAADSSRSWDLRCHLRENMLAYIRNNFPESLPTIRVELRQPETRTRDAVQ